MPGVEGIIHDQSSSGATLFVEPIKVVQQNNAVRELELEEEKEVRRILMELTELVADESIYIRRNIHILAELDFTFAKAKYGYAIDGTTPEMVAFQTQKSPHRHASKEDPAEVAHPGSVIDLRHSPRHPLLDPESVVPVDVYLDDETYLIVVTGPRYGWQNGFAQDDRLADMMAQCGFKSRPSRAANYRYLKAFMRISAMSRASSKR